jgi:hypothetical protein
VLPVNMNTRMAKHTRTAGFVVLAVLAFALIVELL